MYLLKRRKEKETISFFKKELKNPKIKKSNQKKNKKAKIAQSARIVARCLLKDTATMIAQSATMIVYPTG